jgi:hypothetical protein
MFVHTSFTYPQAPRLKSPKNQRGQEEIDDDEDAVDETKPEPVEEVCTHIAFVHNFVGRVCTRIVFVHKCVRHICTHVISVHTNRRPCRAKNLPTTNLLRMTRVTKPHRRPRKMYVSIAFSIVLARCLLIMKIIAIYAATTNQDTNESDSKLKRCSFPECKTLLQS